MNTKTAVALGVTNSFFNSVNTLLFTTNVTCPEYFSSQDGPTPTLVTGSALFLLGMIIEIGAECQRKAFKKDKRNEGKLCREGFWKYVRHANYIGYAIWRTGFAIAAGGWKWGAATAGFTILDFACRASRGLEEHMSQKVGPNPYDAGGWFQEYLRGRKSREDIANHFIVRSSVDALCGGDSL